MRPQLQAVAASRSRRFFYSVSRGFTLIELVACIVILAVLSAIAAPAMWDNQNFSSRGYADELAVSLRYAQRVAIASGCMVQVSVDAAGYQGWQRSTYNTCNSAGAFNQQVLRGDQTALVGATPSGINVNPNTVVVFLSNGTLAGGNAAITVGAFTVSVNAASGQVSLQ